MEIARKVAVCQARPVPGDLQASTAVIIEWMERAARAGAELALFGELFLSDYDLDNTSSLSVPQNGAAAKAIAEAAKRLNIAVIYGYSEVEDACFYDSLLFIDSAGTSVANYRKVHVWPGTEDLHYEAGSVPVVVNWRGMRIGMAICVDVCMSEFIATMVADGGAQMIVVATALVDSPRYDNTPLIIVPARAFENRCFIAYTDLAGEKYSGMSRVCNPNGECIASAKTAEEVLLVATIPVKECENVPFKYHSLRRRDVYVIPYDNEVPWKKGERNDVEAFFKNRAYYYDRQMEGIYNGPKVAAKALSSLIQGKDKRILDIAAGTGLVGKALSEQGFNNITALDRSEEMLKQSALKKVYSKLICGSFEEKAREIPEQAFHSCVCVGAFLTNGFLDPTISIQEMIRLVEVGGVVLLMANSTELDEPECKSTMKSLEAVCADIVKNGVCECMQKSIIPKYLGDCSGIMWIFKKKSDCSVS